MKVLVIDTETTGLPPKGVIHPLTWPHIVQFTFLSVDTENDHVDTHDFILRVPVAIPPEATAIHRITNDMSSLGRDFGDVFPIFYALHEAADMVVGHNLTFDLNMINVELLRRRLPVLQTTVQFCTMREGTAVCNLLHESGYVKWPKLVELHMHLFGEVPVGLHDARVDAMACLRCFYRLHLKRDVLK